MDEEVNDRTHSKNFTRQLADSLKIAKLLDAQPPRSRADLADYCAAVRLSILDTSPGATPNPMLGVSVLQLFEAAIELAPTAPLSTFPDRDQLRTQSQILNAVNDLLTWCQNAKSQRHFNDCEAAVIQALQEASPLKGEDLAAKAGYSYNSHFKATAANLKKNNEIGHGPAGYFALGQD